MIKTNLFP